MMNFCFIFILLFIVLSFLSFITTITIFLVTICDEINIHILLCNNLKRKI